MKIKTSLLGFLAATSVATAQFNLIDDFSTDFANDSFGGGSWTEGSTAIFSATGGLATLTSTGSNTSDRQYVAYDLGANAIAEGEVGTLFLQANIVGPTNTVFGLSSSAVRDVTDSTGINSTSFAWSDFSGIGRFGDSSGTSSDFFGYTGNGSGSGSYGSPIASASASNLYNVWLVIDNENEQMTYHLDNAAGGEILTGTITGTFRTDTTSALDQLVIKSGSSGESFTFDNVYIGAGDLSHINPVAIPEPGTYGLIGGLLALGVILVRRRK